MGGHTGFIRLAILCLLILSIPFFITVLVGTDSNSTERLMAAVAILAVVQLLLGRRIRRWYRRRGQGCAWTN